MSQGAFNPDFNQFCLKWAKPIAGNTTTYGGPILTGSELAQKQMRGHKEDLFEQLLLFDNINFSINGPNTIIPLLYRAMGGAVLESLIEQDALSFTVWTPQPMMSHDKGSVAATFVGRIGDGRGSELDIEGLVDRGLSVQEVGMPDWYKNLIKNKLCYKHRLLDQKLPETAWQVAENALSAGELENVGLPTRSTIIGSSTTDGLRLTDVAESILSYRFILENGLASQNNHGLFQIFDLGARSLRASTSTAARYAIISEYEKFPNLRALYGKVERPFKIASDFRSTHTAERFRHWLSKAVETESQIDVIREYVDACGNRKGLFDSAPAKFLKLTGMVAIGHLVLPQAHLLGVATGALLSSVPAEALGALTETASEVGLGVIDSFIIDNLKIGWTPKAYFDRLRRIEHRHARGLVRKSADT